MDPVLVRDEIEVRNPIGCDEGIGALEGDEQITEPLDNQPPCAREREGSGDKVCGKGSFREAGPWSTAQSVQSARPARRSQARLERLCRYRPGEIITLELSGP
jgi:hypothetical protein